MLATDYYKYYIATKLKYFTIFSYVCFQASTYGKCFYYRNINSLETCLADAPADDVASRIISDVYSQVREGECRLGNPSDFPPHHELREGEEFDFIIVGAG